MNDGEQGGEPRPEPRGMTLTDVMMLSVGVAAAFGIVRLPGSQGGFVPGEIPPRTMLLIAGLMMVWGVATGVTAVAIGRSARFGRPLFPGERLSLLLTAMGIAVIHDGFSEPIESALITTQVWHFQTARWIVAAGWTLVIAVGTVWQSGLRRLGLHWLAASMTVGLTFLAIQGPIAHLNGSAWSLFALFREYRNTTPDGLLLGVVERICQTPLGLLVAFPSLATFASLRRRKNGPWTAWAGMVLAWPILFALLLVLPPTHFRTSTPGWLVERGFCLLWTTLEWWFAWRVLRWWNEPQRGIGSPAAIRSAT